jgi:hypothetical protein
VIRLPRTHRMRRAVRLGSVLLIGGVLAASGSAGAQERSPSVAALAVCPYERCALSIVPTWNGLTVVRGNTGSQVASLYFLWPRDIGVALSGPDAGVIGADSARASAHRAVQLRRIGALLTDVGLALAAGAAVDAARGRPGGRWQRSAVALAGASLVVSVPFHFAADGALSRALWWHNLRYAR